jgi:hypothetical protein
VLIATTNVGTYGPIQEYTITYHPYNTGDKICNVLNMKDCMVVESSGIIITLMYGESKVYYLA